MRAEDIINSIPEDTYSDKPFGDIKMKFIRIIPSFKIIEKNVALGFFFNSLQQIIVENKQNGIAVNINENNLKISDYYKFVTTLFKNQKVEVIDCQRVGGGHPDFKLKHEDGLFYIEYKSTRDSIKPNQLEWMGENSNEEVWFLIMEEIKCFLETDEEYYRKFHLKTASSELAGHLVELIKDKLQNNETKITGNNNGNT